MAKIASEIPWKSSLVGPSCLLLLLDEVDPALYEAEERVGRSNGAEDDDGPGPAVADTGNGCDTGSRNAEADIGGGCNTAGDTGGDWRTASTEVRRGRTRSGLPG